MKKEETKAEVEQSILKELKLDGLINADENVVEHLERNLSGTSTFYPLRMNKTEHSVRHQKLYQRRTLIRFLRIQRRKKKN